MAGGNAADIRAPWPKGANGLVQIQFPTFDIEASKTDHIVQVKTALFAFTAEYCEVTGNVITVGNALSFNIEDDTATPQVFVENAAVTALVEGTSGVVELTTDNSITVNAGATFNLSYISGAGDTGTNVCVTLWVKPKF